MKKLLLFVVLALGSAGASAQWIRVGPEVGANWSRFNVDDPYADNADFGARIGWKVGGIVDIGFDRMFSIQPGVFFNQKGSTDKYSEHLGGTYATYNNKVRVNYLELPLNFQLKFGRPRRGQFFIGAGPYVAFAIGGEVKERRTLRENNGTPIVTTSDQYDLEIGDNAQRDDIKGTDAGLNLNLGFQAPRGFFIRGNSGIGLTNIVPGGGDDYTWKNLSMSLTVGMLFGR